MIINLPIQYSDHEAVIVSTDEIRPFTRRMYKFEAMWLISEDCEREVEEA